MPKQFLKQSLRQLWPGTQAPILVASMGRSGSTLVYDSLVDGMARVRFGPLAIRMRGVVRDVAWSLDEADFRRGHIYKTHDFPHALHPEEEVRAVFLFGNASSAAHSVLHCEIIKGRSWIDEHFKHLFAKGTFEDVPKRDVLRFGEQLDAWLSAEAVPVLALRYEDLWQSNASELLSRYAGFPVTLPAKRARSSTAQDFGDRGIQIVQTYNSLDERISALPPVLMNSKARTIMQAAAS